MDPLSFTFLAYAAFCLARGALGPQAPGWALTVTGGLSMMLLDVVIDPIAVRGDQWFLERIFYYPEGGVYFGVPLSNFAGWALVGMGAIGGFLALTGGARGERPTAGIALYYAVLAFNLVVTAWIQEWTLLVLGLVVHAAAAAALYVTRRRPAAGPGMESQKA
jgi:uncharacterized membrane protein